MTKDIILGIDTSNYTTSLSAVTLSGALLFNSKQLLKVKPGERGLRQSDALFSHNVNLPILFSDVADILKDFNIVAVSVSDKPRDVEGSYMPCFLAGVVAASSISSAMNVPLYKFSHQNGHIMAALFSSQKHDLISKGFCAFHVSGGTTEMLRATPEDHLFRVECIGESVDAHAGQIIDRIGVLMDLPFPAGPHMEKLALENVTKVPKKKICVNGLKTNISGLENMAANLYKTSKNKPLVSAFVFDFIGRTLDKLSDNYTAMYGKTPFVYSGGVMCNSLIKNMLSISREAYFAEPKMSADNAVGVAELGRIRFLSENK